MQRLGISKVGGNKPKAENWTLRTQANVTIADIESASKNAFYMIAWNAEATS